VTSVLLGEKRHAEVETEAADHERV
jgi:hypothetical protein